MINKDDCVKVAVCARPHGVGGEVVVRTAGGFGTDDVSYEFLFLELGGGLVPFYVEELRIRNAEEALVKFEGVDSQADARRIAEAAVYVDRSWLGDADGDVTVEMLVGFEASERSHGLIGTIAAIDDSVAGNPLFVIERPDGGEVLVPMNDDLVDTVDAQERRVVFCLPEGLLQL